MKRMLSLNTVSEVIARYGSNRSSCKSEILALVKAGKAKTRVDESGGDFKVVVDGFVLESFNTLNAANFYRKRIGG